MIDKWQPTHLLKLNGGGRWQVNCIPIGRGKIDKLIYYNCTVGPRNRSGYHFISRVPETNLVPFTPKKG